MPRKQDNPSSIKASKIIIRNKSVSYYFTRGEKHITILFIHGLGSSKDDFLPAFNIPELREYHLLAPDLIGHGESNASNEFTFTMDDQANVLAELLENLSISNDLILVPHSMGGPIAVSLAEQLRNKIAGMIYAEGNLDEGDCFFSQKIIEKYSIEEWRESGFKEFVDRFMESSDTAEYAYNFIKSGPDAIYRSSQDLFKVSIENTLLSRIIQLDIPFLGVFGEKNKGRFSSEKKISEHFPIRYVTNAGHYMMHDNPGKFYKIIADFVDKIRSEREK